MYTEHPYKFISVCRSFIVIVCCGISACVPVPFLPGNPTEDTIDNIVPGETERSKVHQLLGKPMISNEVWGVDVYRAAGKEVVVYLPLPIYETYPLWYFTLIVYDNNGIVKALDDDAWTSLEAEGFRFYASGMQGFLLAPKVDGNFDHPNQEILEECILYLIPDGSEENILVNKKRISGGINKGYFRLRLAPGVHLVSFSTGLEQGAKSLYCEPGHILYVQFTTKYFFVHRLESGMKGVGYKIELTDTPPDELFERQLIIYPTMPAKIMPNTH